MRSSSEKHHWFAALVSLFLAATSSFAQLPAGKPVFDAGITAACAAATGDQSLVLVVFSATWCEPCQMLRKTSLESSNFLDHVGLIHIVDIDVDADPRTTSAYDASSIPTIVLMTGDKKIIARETGFIEPAKFLDWIEQGRRRSAQGLWEGVAPTGRLEEFLAKNAAGSLSSEDILKLVDVLDDPNPAERGNAGQLILAQREASVPPLIDAVTNAYLGIRIAANELLHTLAPDSPGFDPWLSPADLSGSADALRKWWTDTGKLPPPAETAADPSLKSSLDGALRDLRGDDPVKRTEAMSALVLHGQAALSPVREAILRAERDGNHPLVSLLEDVLWDILVPADLEKETGGVRHALARGTSPEQQAAATRLGHAGKDGLPALVELTASADPLVVESAVRALTSLGGEDVIPGLAALLKSADSNLRMTAAQSLGHTRSDAANKYLLSVINDPNEVVACAAISALEEINSPPEYSTSSKETPAEVIAGFRAALSDTRWRVRATTAEAVGKLSARDLIDDLKKLLDDPDGFVVKTALTSLHQMSAQPDSARLLAVTRRLPSLRQDVVAVLLEAPSAESAAVVTNLYFSGTVEQQIQMINALVRERGGEEVTGAEDVWGPLVNQAVTSPEPRLRRATANALAVLAKPAQASLITTLLADDDPETRKGGARAVLQIMMAEDERKTELAARPNSESGAATNAFLATGQIAAWHDAFLKRPDPSPDPVVAVALYLTGDGMADLPVLTQAVAKPAAFTLNSRSSPAQALTLALKKLPWPEGRTVLDKVCASPALFTAATTVLSTMNTNAAAYLLEPSRFRAAVEPASGDQLNIVLTALLGGTYVQGGSWSLLGDGPGIQPVLNALLQSTNNALRALALFSVGRSDATNHLAAFQEAVKSSDPWLRVAAVQGLAKTSTERTNTDALLGPLLADPDPQVVRMAAIGLLEPEVRSAADLEREFKAFRYGATRGAISYFDNSAGESRPLSVLETKPAFLEQIRQRPSAGKNAASDVIALLLAQYGEFDLLDKMINSPAFLMRPARESESESEMASPLLAGIALSHDVKYVPLLRKYAQTNSDQTELRKVLQAMRGMTGPDARELRLSLNRLIQAAGNN